MPWIQTITADQANGDLSAVYQRIYQLYPPEYKQSIPALVKSDGTEDSIVAAHSLIPRAMEHMMSAHGVLIQPELPLSRRQHEMIATIVSAQNHCVY